MKHQRPRVRSGSRTMMSIATAFILTRIVDDQLRPGKKRHPRSARCFVRAARLSAFRLSCAADAPYSDDAGRI